MACTSAPATAAPLVSTTRPVIVPLELWASSMPVNSNDAAKSVRYPRGLSTRTSKETPVGRLNDNLSVTSTVQEKCYGLEKTHAEAEEFARVSSNIARQR